MSTLEAPERISRREAVTAMLVELPDVVEELLVLFGEGSCPTTSFMHELVHETVVVDRVGMLCIGSSDEYVVELATTAARSFGVLDRVTFGVHPCNNPE